MKQLRHKKILEIISENEICTQEGILEKLLEVGITATQATVSRDIKRLNLIKRLTPEGKYVYATQNQKPKATSNMKLKSVFIEAVIKVDYAMNTAVIKCNTGMGNAVCATLDLMEWDGVVGTLAGDDTIFVLLRNEENARRYTEKLNKLLEEN